MVPTSADGCEGPSGEVVITVDPFPNTSPITGENSLCIGATNEIYEVVNTPGSSYSWTVPGSLDMTFNNNTYFIIVDAIANGSGNITVTESNSYGCVGTTEIFPVTVSNFATQELITGPEDVCRGASGVTYSVPDNAGSTYTWSTPPGASITSDPSLSAVDVDFNLVVTGDFSVIETNASGCVTVHHPLTVTVHPIPNIYTVSAPPYYCFGGTGVTVTLSNSQSGVNYQLYRGGVAEGAVVPGTGGPLNWANQTAGIYTIEGIYNTPTACAQMMNGSPLVEENSEITVSSVTLSTSTEGSHNLNCHGDNTGTIQINVTGGAAPYEYSINGGSTYQVSNTFSNLTAGIYTVRIRDARGCIIDSAPITLTQPDALVLTSVLETQPVSCFGGSDGAAEVVVDISTGVAPYSYQWYEDASLTTPVAGAALATMSGVEAGTYYVEVTDANMCPITGGVIITEPDVLEANRASTDVTCFGADDGTITLSNPAGGYGTYEYSIDGGVNWQLSPDFTGLAPDSYNVYIRDGAHPTCAVQLDPALVIDEPTELDADIASSDVTCFGANNGTITLTDPVGGYGTYEYSIDGGASWQSSGSFSGLLPGSYDVYIRDAVQTACAIQLDPTLLIDEPAILDADVASTDITCFGAGDGEIDITNPSGGLGTYEYSINGGGSWHADGDFTGLFPGTYNVRIRDAAETGCVIVLDPALVITQPAVLNATVSRTNVTCNGADDGIIDITLPTGGYGTYAYSIDGGVNWQTGGTFSGLAPGMYDVRIRDDVNQTCVVTLNNALLITEPPVLSAIISHTDVTCFGGTDGSISLSNPSGGYGTYEYSISGGATWQGTVNFTGLPAGSYDIYIRDAANIGCEIQLDGAYLVDEPVVLDADVASTDATCFGVADGTIVISTPTGGHGTYQYSIDGGSSWQISGTFSGLAPGPYDVYIRDAVQTACEMQLDGSVTIDEPAILDADVASSDVSCFGGADGSITITNETGGYGTYEFSINGGITWQSSGTFTGLPASSYAVYIRDGLHSTCEILLDPALVIDEPAALNADVASTNVTCFGAADGTISITNEAGGYGTYEFSIDGGATWQGSGIFTALAPGSYDVRIRDAVHTACETTLNSTLLITQPAILDATILHTDVSCFSGSDGSITISNPTGGYGTYDYSIDGGATWQGTVNFAGLPAGPYNVYIRDAANTGCEIQLDGTYLVDEPAVLDADVASTNVTCFGATDGTITVSNPTGGYGTYQYSIDGGISWQMSGTFTGLAPVSYDVMIRDAANATCQITLQADLQITQPAVLGADIATTNVTCFGNGDGIIAITNPTGGYGTYEYSINGGGSWQSSGTFAGLGTGLYAVMIRDAAYGGCIITLDPAVEISQPALLNATATFTAVTCNGNSDGAIDLTVTGGTAGYDFLWSGPAAYSSTDEDPSGLAAGSYSVTVTDQNGCTAAANVTVTEPTQLELNPTADVLLNCYGDTNGTGAFYASGGTMGYTFTEVTNSAGATLAAPGFNSQSIFNAGEGNVTVRVTDGNGCQTDATITFTQPDKLEPGEIGSDQVICFGEDPAAITETVAASGGPGVRNYQWQMASTAAGTYNNIPGATAESFAPLGLSATTYYRREVRSGMCNPEYTDTVEVIVNELPSGLLTGGETICSGESSVLNVAVSGGAAPYEIEIGNYGDLPGYGSGDDIIVTPLGTTTYKLLRIKDNNGCEVSDPSAYVNGEATVVVRALPVITVHPTDTTLCEYRTITFEAAASGEDLAYKWEVFDGTLWSDVENGGVYSGATTTSLLVFSATRGMDGNRYRMIASSCGTADTTTEATLMVETPPEIADDPADATICEGENTQFVVDVAGDGLVYEWYVDDGVGPPD